MPTDNSDAAQVPNGAQHANVTAESRPGAETQAEGANHAGPANNQPYASPNRQEGARHSTPRPTEAGPAYSQPVTRCKRRSRRQVRRIVTPSSSSEEDEM